MVTLFLIYGELPYFMVKLPYFFQRYDENDMFP